MVCGWILSGQMAYIRTNFLKIYCGTPLRRTHTPENTDILKEISLVMAVKHL